MRHGWEIKKLGEVCEIERGGSPRPIKEYLTNSQEGINWIKIGDADGSKYITKTKEKIKPEGIKKSRYVYSGDFLLSNSMSFGRPYILAIDGCIHDGWLVIHDTNNYFNKSYLYYYLGSSNIYKEFKRLAVGGVVNNLNTEIVKNVNVYIPPLSEQERIVAELDLLSDVIAKKREQLKQLDTLAQSIFYDMFGDPIANEKGWEQVSLVDICKNTGVYGAGSSSIPRQPHRPRYIRITDILDSGDLNDDFVVSSNIEDDHTYRLNVGDILFARSGATVGKTYLYRGKEAQIHAGYLIKFSLDILHVNPLFIFYITKNRSYKLWISNQIIGVAQPNINAQKYGKLPIILPPLPLQQQFTSKIEAIEKQKELIKQSLSEVQQLFDSRMDYYFG